VERDPGSGQTDHPIEEVAWFAPEGFDVRGHVEALFTVALRIAPVVVLMCIGVLVASPRGAPVLLYSLPGVALVLAGLVALRRTSSVFDLMWEHPRRMVWLSLATVAITCATGATRSPYGMTCLLAVGLSSILGYVKEAAMWALLACVGTLAASVLTGQLAAPSSREALVSTTVTYLSFAAALIAVLTIYRVYLLRPEVVGAALASPEEFRTRLLLERRFLRVLNNLGLLRPLAEELLAALAQGAHQRELANEAMRPRIEAANPPDSGSMTTELERQRPSRSKIGRTLRDAREATGARTLPELVAAYMRGRRGIRRRR
jgi:hypothetical protein